MLVLKIATNGKEFFTKSLCVSNLSEGSSVSILEMSEEEYNSIPATTESYDFFKEHDNAK